MNKVVIVGGDHYNALGLARVFGVSGIKPYGILITKGIDISHFCAYKSRYWKRWWHVIDENDAIELLIKEFSDMKPLKTYVSVYKKIVLLMASKVDVRIAYYFDYLVRKLCTRKVDHSYLDSK